MPRSLKDLAQSALNRKLYLIEYEDPSVTETTVPNIASVLGLAPYKADDMESSALKVYRIVGVDDEWFDCDNSTLVFAQFRTFPATDKPCAGEKVLYTLVPATASIPTVKLTWSNIFSSEFQERTCCALGKTQIKVKNKNVEGDETVKITKTCGGGNDGWFTIPPGGTETWSRCIGRQVTIEARYNQISSGVNPGTNHYYVRDGEVTT